MTDKLDSGKISQINYPLVKISGFSKIKPNEVVDFGKGRFGQVISFNQDGCIVSLFFEDHLQIGDPVTATGKMPQISFDAERVFGTVINPLGETLLSHNEGKRSTHLEIDTPALPLSLRANLNQQLETGVSIVDSLLPLAKGQREIIVGDKKVGKTNFLRRVIKTQAQQRQIIVYALVGKRISAAKQLYEYLKREKITKQVITIASLAHHSAGLINLTPFAAMAVAEFYRDQGHDVVVVLDNLSNHAQFYRQLSLLAAKFPGRDSYPGDIFYTHARLLERAGNFKHPFDPQKTNSVTCLPMVESAEGDLTDFIVSNLIGITDGHLFFNKSLFEKGQRPAIDFSLSVTRVGKQTQNPIQRELNYQITAFLAKYNEVLKITHFGSDLPAESRKIVDKGNLLLGFFEEGQNEQVPLAVQQVLLTIIYQEILAFKNKDELQQFKTNFLQSYQQNESCTTLMDKLVQVKDLDTLIQQIENNLPKIKKYGATAA